MNLTRDSEVNVTIIQPENNELISPNTDFNVSANITALIGDANQCEATITISNTSIANVKNGNTNQINQILKDETITTIFELESYGPGQVNITVQVLCDSDGIIFEGKNTDTIYNITIIDDLPPVITIISPANNTEEKATNEITFRYNVTDHSEIEECRLIINGTTNQTSTSVEKNIEQTFTATLENNYYEWRIECDDFYENTGTTETRNLYVRVYFPIITNIAIQEIINLNPGNTKTITCNATIEDENGADDITSVNATLHREKILDFEQNNNNVYINNSCSLISSSENIAEYSCDFNVYYYAENGTWHCNVTSLDQQGLTNNNYENTTIDTLYAINLSSLILEYGEIPTNDLSEEKILEVQNIGNMPLTVFVRGYAGSEPEQNYSMICDNSETIPLENQRYSTIADTDFNEKNGLTSTFQEIINNMQKQTTETMISQNTYWNLQTVPMSVTNCEGTIVFSVTN
jgi:hypothetical protein